MAQSDPDGDPVVKIPDRVFFGIGDVADLLHVDPPTLRYWETEFSQLSPRKSAGGHRRYRKADVRLLVRIRELLHVERYTIEGAKRVLRRKPDASDGQGDGRDTALLATLAEIRAELQQIRKLLPPHSARGT